MALEPQAAYEQAVVNAIRAQLGYPESQCGRGLDGRPPPACGPVWVSVWGEGKRPADPPDDNLDERFGVNVTVTIRTAAAWDRIIRHRDELEGRVNAIRALVQRDSLDHSLKNAANALAGRTHSAADTARRVGFCEPLALEGIDAVRECGEDWFMAKSKAKGGPPAGLAQTVRFGGARLLQASGTAG